MAQPQPTILGRKCGSLGYGMLGLTWRGEPKPFEQSIPVMKRALELGADNWNAGEIYGTPDRNSMHLLRAYFHAHPEDAARVILNVKGGTEPGTLNPNSSEENTRRSVDTCLALLADTAHPTIDIFEFARVDSHRGNDSALRVLATYVHAGQIRAIGLSEVNARTIRASHTLLQSLGLPGVASVEVELSLWSPDIFGNGVAAVCAELNIPIFAYSPLARGAISDAPVRKNADIPAGDMRKALPKYQDDVLAVNNRIVDEVGTIAKEKGATTAQIAIAWVRGQTGRVRIVVCEDGERREVRLGTVIPIPGASTLERVEENFKEVVLSEEEMGVLDGLVEKFPVIGDRYHEQGMKHVNG